MNALIKKLGVPAAYCACALTGYALIDKADKAGTVAGDATVMTDSAAAEKGEGGTGDNTDSLPLYTSLMLPAACDSTAAYTLQLGAYLSKRAAEQASDAPGAGLNGTSIIMTKDEAGDPLYVLSCGKFTTYAAAEKEMILLRSGYSLRCRIIRIPGPDK